MSPALVMLIAAGAVFAGIVVAIIFVQDQTIDRQRRTIDVLRRAERRQAAAADIARAEATQPSHPAGEAVGDEAPRRPARR